MRYLLFTLFALFVIGCTKADNPTMQSSTFMRNGSQWNIDSASIVESILQKDTIITITFHQNTTYLRLTFSGSPYYMTIYPQIMVTPNSGGSVADFWDGTIHEYPHTLDGKTLNDTCLITSINPFHGSCKLQLAATDNNGNITQTDYFSGTW